MFLLIMFALLLTSTTVHAFEPQKHVEFSHDAIALYKSCTGNFTTALEAQALADGAEDEDNWTPSRGLNWHFYNNDKKIGKYTKYLIFPCNGSNEKIFATRIEELHDAINDKKSTREEIYYAAGRAAHHIQDMSSPPHVMPIYHTGNDRFDKYPPEKVSNMVTEEACRELKADVAGPDTILEKAATAALTAATAQVVFTGGKTIAGETWAKFWDGGASGEYAGFRNYGVYGNTYGEKRVVLNRDGMVEYDRKVFDSFFDERRRHAVLDTAKLLVYIDRLIERGNTPNAK